MNNSDANEFDLTGLTHAGAKNPRWLSPSAEFILSVVEGLRINSVETLREYLSVWCTRSRSRSRSVRRNRVLCV